MADIIKLRRDTAANWTSANPVLAEGEMGIETDTKLQKSGDGTTAWNSLPYMRVECESSMGSSEVKPMSQKAVTDGIMNHGSAFDISAYNATGGVLAKYADLTAALTALNALPSAYKRGGMSIKYVQSFDDKYVQYRYMSTSTANADIVNVANWQGVDEEPTAGSRNLIESGGVYIAIDGKQDRLSFDNFPTEDSQNPVSSDGIHHAISIINEPKTLYVNGATGDDGNDGLSAESPFKTIQAAINACAVTNNNGKSPLNTINVDPNSTYDYILVSGKVVKIQSTGVINIVTTGTAILATRNGYLEIAADMNVQSDTNYGLAAQYGGILNVTKNITLSNGVYIDQGSQLKDGATLTINTSKNRNIIDILHGSNAHFSNVVLTNTFPGGINGATICVTYSGKLRISNLTVTENRKAGVVAAIYNSVINLGVANITDNSVDNITRSNHYLYARAGGKLTADTVTINNTNLNIADTSIACGAYEDGITQVNAITTTNVGTEYTCDMSSIYLSPNVSCVGKAGDISVLPLLEADRNITITSDERISALDENTQYAAIPDDVIDVICTTATEDAWVFDKNNVPTRTNVSSALTSIDGMMSPYEGVFSDDDLTSEDYKAVYHIPDLTNVTSARVFCCGNKALKYINLEAFRRGGNITTMYWALAYADSLGEIDTTPLKALTRCTNADGIFFNYQGTHLDWTFLGSMPLTGVVDSVIRDCWYLRTLDLSFITNAWSGVTELNQVVRNSCAREDFVGVLDISPLAQLTNLKKLQYTVCNLSVNYSNNYNSHGVEKITGCQALNTLVNMEDASGFLAYNHWTEGIDYSFLAAWTKLTMYRHFSDGNRGKTVDLTPFANLTRLNNIAYFCANMWELEKLDMTPLNDCPINTEVQFILRNDNMLVDLTLPSRAWFAQAAVTNIDLSQLTSWVKNVNTSINNLYDRAANSLPTFTIKLSNASYAMLTQEDITAAVAKGYTIIK